MKFAVGADIPHREHIASTAAVQTNGRLQRLTPNGDVHHAEPGAIGYGGAAGEKVGLRDRNEAGSHRAIHSKVHVP